MFTSYLETEKIYNIGDQPVRQKGVAINNIIEILNKRYNKTFSFSKLYYKNNLFEILNNILDNYSTIVILYDSDFKNGHTVIFYKQGGTLKLFDPQLHSNITQFATSNNISINEAIRIMRSRNNNTLDSVFDSNLNIIDINNYFLAYNYTFGAFFYDKNRTILGPHTYEYYTIGNKNIYLFGEYHVSPNCDTPAQEFDKFIDDVVKSNPDKKYDIFLEKLYRNTDTNEIYIARAGVYLNWSQDFLNCFTVDKTQCREVYNNVRGHYIDARDMSERIITCKISEVNPTSIYILWSLASIIYNTYEYSDRITSPGTREDYNLFYNKYFGDYRKVFNLENFQDLKENILSILNDTVKINKQYDNITDKDFAKRIIKYFNTKIESYFTNIRQRIISVLNNINLNNNSNEQSYIVEAKNITQLYFSAYTLIMDKYAIGRLFREHRVDRQRDETYRSKNVIFYIGDLHRQTYSELFQKVLKSNPIYSSIGTPSRNCVTVDLENFIEPEDDKITSIDSILASISL